MKKIYLPMVALVTLLTLSVTVIAARHKMLFTGKSSSNWSTPKNWMRDGVQQTSNTTGVLPGNGDSIVITTDQSAYIGNGNFNTDVVTVQLNNVIIVVQKGATLQLGNGNSFNIFYYYGVLTLDNASVLSLEKGDTHNSAGLITANPKGSSNGANNKVTIGGVLKFGGNTSYSTTLNNSGVGFVNGPARADATTGSGSNGFAFGSLPVVLVGFNANLTAGNKVNIEWNTQQEISTDRFEIERSNDGLNWQTLATVTASGFSSTPKSYTSQDATPQKGINLYRLKMIDYDGNFGYSDIVNVRLNLMGKISLYPNPSVNQVTVSLSEVPASDWTLTLINTSGQVVLQKRFSKDLTTASMSVSNYPTGNYTVQISDGVSSQLSKLMIAHQ